jgi:putative salt-induced outer membrane protein YdiY
MKRILLAFAALSMAALGAARADDVELVTGEKLKGTIVSRDANQIVLDHPVLGRLTIPIERVKPEAPPAPPPSPWAFRAELGASGSSGNVNQSALHAAIGAVLDDDARRLKMDLVYSRAKVEGTITEDKTYFEATHDWKFKDSKWTVFATGRMDWDKFQSWDRRATVGAGAGYTLSDTDTLKARVRGGFGAAKEWGNDDPDDNKWRPEALLGGEASWKVNDTNTIEGRVTYYRDLENTDKYRVIATLSWSVKLAKDSPLSLKIGCEDEYDTHRSSPYDTNDFRYFAALVCTF